MRYLLTFLLPTIVFTFILFTGSAQACDNGGGGGVFSFTAPQAVYAQPQAFLAQSRGFVQQQVYAQPVVQQQAFYAQPVIAQPVVQRVVVRRNVGHHRGFLGRHLQRRQAIFGF